MTINSDGTVTITLPVIRSASFTVNPVAAQGITKLSVEVAEETKILYPKWRYSGELYAGESDKI